MERSGPNIGEEFEDHGLEVLSREELDQAQKDYDERRQVSSSHATRAYSKTCCVPGERCYSYTC